MPDIIVVGCGFAGAVAARRFAETGNKKVLILEKRPHIAGNMYESADTNGVSVHRYGPHIFHTGNEAVFRFLKRFSAWFPYEHRVLGSIDGQLVPIPFNFTSMEVLLGKEKAGIIRKKLLRLFPKAAKVSVLDLTGSPDALIREFGDYVYEKVFVHYTAKQWGVPPSQVDRSVINRVPVVLGNDDRYFADKFQYMPADGFTKLFENILHHPNIEIQLNCDAAKRIRIQPDTGRLYLDGAVCDKPVVYTGAIDELLGYRYGPLPYRSLDLAFEQYGVTFYQPAAVVNYPNEEDFTRITEFKHLTGQKLENATTILKEYPRPYDPHAGAGNIPFYPIPSDKNLSLYRRYRDSVAGIGNLYFCGRLAEYKYYNMDAVISRALEFPLAP